VIELAKEIYKNQILSRGLDGMRLDASGRNHCLKGEKIYLDNKKYGCVDPSTEKHSPLVLYRELKKLKTPDQVFMAEVQYTEAIASDYMWKYPYYPATPDIDEVAEVSEGYEFLSMLRSVKTGEFTSSKLVEWINNQPILYNRQRFRMIRNWNGVDRSVVSFVATDPRYYPVVTMAATIPGIPKVSDYELFGDKYADDYYKITPTSSPENRKDHWKKILNIRNSSNPLKYGDIKDVWRSGDNIYAYSRTYENETVIAVINFSGKTATSVLNLPFKSGAMLSDELSNDKFTVNDPSNFRISVPAYGARILTVKK
jgi:glycosidase